MKKLSTGDYSTLGNYRRLVAVCFSEGGGAVRYLDAKIAESPRGANEEVLADEGQMMFLLASIEGEK